MIEHDFDWESFGSFSGGNPSGMLLSSAALDFQRTGVRTELAQPGVRRVLILGILGIWL